MTNEISKIVIQRGDTNIEEAWRNEHDLVPHEDTNCRTIRLVYRPAHEAFDHRRGIANAKNIKKHFNHDNIV